MDAPQMKTPGWALAAGALAAAVLLHVASMPLLPFVLAAILAFLLDPAIVRASARTRLPRWAAATILYLLLMGSLGALALFTAVGAAKDGSEIAAHGFAPLRSGLAQAIGPGVQLFGHEITADQALGWLQEGLQKLATLVTAGRLARPAFEAGVGLVLFVVLSFYMMLSWPSLVRGALWLTPPKARETVERLAPEMASVIRRYFLGVIAVVVFTAVFAWLGYGLALHVPGAALLAVSVGVLETAPVIGPIIAAALVALSALQLHSLVRGAAMVGYALALRLGIDDVVAPIVLGRSVTVHPVVVMLAYVLGAVLFGATGLLLAVPFAACLRIWLRSVYERSPADRPRGG